eukprot:m51a1_g8370 putative glutamine amidotransferase (251) ;mRNA; f:146110-147135
MAPVVLILKLWGEWDHSAYGGDFDDFVAAGMRPALPSSSSFRLVDPRASLAALPASLDDVAAVVVPGSFSNVTDRLEWSERTAKWIREVVVPSGTPFLGICYGHQLLAHALGGLVDFRSGGPEMGAIDVRWQPEAASDALFGQFAAAPARAFFTHSQSVLRAPASASTLSVGADGGSQVISVRGASAWGVQYHPEFFASIVRAFSKMLAVEPVGLPEGAPEMLPHGQQLLAAFARLASDRYQRLHGSNEA